MSVQKIGPVSKSQHSFDSGDEPICAFLNRKLDVDSSGKRAKDRTWNLLWCSLNLKKNILELYKVDGILKQPDEPPPKDTMLSPIQEQQKHKIGFVDVLNSKTEIDYTSQMDKDIQKRRKFLFRLMLANGAQDLFQASTEIQRNHWVMVLKRAAIPFVPEEVIDGPHLPLVSSESRLKTARCSVTRRTKHTVDSLTCLSATPMTMIEDMNAEISPADLKLRVQALKSLLHKKRELLKQLNRMNASFNGDISFMYSEFAQSPASPKWTPSIPLLDEDRRFSLPIMMASEDSDSDHRSSMEDSSSVSFIHHSASQYNYTCNHKATETTLLSDFYLIPGAEWSLLKANETVLVIGLLPNGWYRCVALRDAVLSPSVAISHERVDSTGDTSGYRDTLERPVAMGARHRPESEEFGMEPGFGDCNVSVADNTSTTTGSGQSQNDDDDDDEISTLRRFTEKDMPPRNTDRNVSYRIATRQHHVDSSTSFSDRDSFVRSSWSDTLPGRYSITSSIFSEGLAVPSNSIPFDQPIEGNDPLAILISSELKRDIPSLPLVGCLPPSVLAGFADKNRDRFPPLPATLQRGSVPSPAPLDDSSVDDTPQSPRVTTPMVTSFPMAISTSSSVPSIMTEEFVPSSVPANMGSEFVPPHPIPEVSVVSCPTPEPSLAASSTPDLLITSSTSMDSISTPIPSSSSMDLSPVTPEVFEVESTNLPGGVGGLPGGPRRSELLSESTQDSLLRPSKAALDRRKSSNDGRRGSKSSVREVGASPQGKGGANALDSKPSFLKKLFGRKKSLPPSVDPRTSRRSSSPSVLEQEMRPRLASQSGQAVTVVRGAVLIGDSDTSDEEDGEEGIPKDSQIKRSSSDHSSLKNAAQTEGSVNYKELTNKRLMSPTWAPPSPMAQSHKSPIRKDSYVFDTLDSSKINSIFRAPPQGERRKVTLPRNEPKYGFKLETYISYSDRTVKHTLVQSVNLGSPAFLAGLFAGDMIVEVEGVNVSRCAVEEVVSAFKAEKPGETTIQMTVVFVDGVSRLDKKKKAEGLRKELRQKQQKLKELVEKEKTSPTTLLFTTPIATPSVTTPMVTSSVTTPMASPSVTSPMAAPSVTTSTATPSVITTAATPSETTSMATPPVTIPTATPSDTTPVATPLATTLAASSEQVCAGIAPKPIVTQKGWIMWEEAVTSTKPNGPSLYQYNGHLNKSIVLHNREINTLSCDVVIMPSSSCWGSVITAKQNNAMYQYLRRGGSGLWDELSLIKHGKLGDVMSTGGHGLPVRRVYHCLIGRNEDSVQLCVGEALRLARNEGHLTVALWVDGFAYAQVPIGTLVEYVRHWLAEEDGNGLCFHRVIFSCSTFFSDTETQVERCFPHQRFDPSDMQGDSDQSDSVSSDDDSRSPGMTQEELVTKDKSLAPLSATDQTKVQVQPQFEFDIMPGALQSDV